MKLSSRYIGILLAVLLIAAGVGVYYYFHRHDISTDSATIEGQVVSISPKVQGSVYL